MVKTAEKLEKIRAEALPVNETKYWVRCDCGWQGYDWQMKKGYTPLYPDDVVPCRKCPECGNEEDICEVTEL